MRWNGRWEKMSKSIAKNELTVMTKRLWREINLYWKFMCTDKSDKKNKTKLPSLSPSTPATVFLIAEKLLNLWIWYFYIQFIFINCFVEN